MVPATEDDTETETERCWPRGTTPSEPPHDVLAAEREHLIASREYLRLMREDVLSLPALAGDRVSEQYLKADLYRRAESLRDLPDTPLFFGRLDYAGAVSARGDDPPEPPDEDFHIGRRHVNDPEGRPAVIDWRAPVSRPFYRASQSDPMALTRRRRFGFSGGELTAYEDEVFSAGPVRPASGTGTEPILSRIMIEEIERPRSGAMRDIVATIQPEQDDIVRADATLSVCVQGAPGTGKTAVGLHRIAFLMYAYRERMSRGGVLVLGPNRAFLTYIRNVLPALGEFDATQTSVTEMIATVPIRGVDSERAAIVKGDARMATVLRRALWERISWPTESIMLPRGSRRWRVSADRLAELVAELRDRGVRYGTGREMLSHRIAHVILTLMEAGGEPCDDRTHEAVRRTSVVKNAVNAIWPKAEPVKVAFSLLSDREVLARDRDRQRAVSDPDGGACAAGGDIDRRDCVAAAIGAVVGDVGSLAVRRDRDRHRAVSDLDRGARVAGGDVDRRGCAAAVVGDVGGLAVRRDRDPPRAVPDPDRGARVAGRDVDRRHRAAPAGAVAGHVCGLAVRRNRDPIRTVPDPDRGARATGGHIDRRDGVAAVGTVVGDVGGLAVRRDRDRA